MTKPRLFAIGDLHLSFADIVDKPMDVFGANWRNHTERLESEWRESVSPEDTVLVLGDISWALKRDDAMPDLEWIRALPGRKILLRGNHDLWWHGVTNLNALWPGEMIFLQNNSVMFEETPDSEQEGAIRISVCGSRGWGLPGLEDYGKDDEKIVARELIRLKLSFESAKKAGATAIVCALHFPPAIGPSFASVFTDMIESYEIPVVHVVYGHLHTPAAFRRGIQGMNRGVHYSLASADFLDFKPMQVL